MVIAPTPSKGLFIGRRRELKLFEDMLFRKRPEWILHISGPGGIGKTRLLEQMLEEAQTIQVEEPLKGVLLTAGLVDFYKTANHTFFGLLGDIARQLGWIHFGTFEKELSRFRHLLSREPEPDVTERHEAARRVTEAFFDDYGRLIRDYRIVLLFDTCEEARGMENWLMDTFLPRLVSLEELTSTVDEEGTELETAEMCVDHTILVIAGRKQLAFPEHLASYVNVRTLEPFTVEETRAFFREGGLGPERVSEELLEQIHDLSAGSLLYIALSFDWLYNEVGTPEELVAPGESFGERLISWVLRLKGDEDRAILYMALAWRRMHTALLSHLLQMEKEEADELIERMSRFSFIKYRPPGEEFKEGSVLLHDEMRDLVMRHAWPKFGSEDTKRQLLQQVIGWYRERIRELEGDDVLAGTASPRYEETRYLLAEWGYYQMRVSLEKGFASVEPLFRQAVHHLDLAFCELLNEEVNRFSNRLTHAQLDQLRFREALTASRRERFGEAIDIWRGLLRRPDFDRKLQATTLMLLTEAESYTGRVDQAIEHGEKAEKLYKQLLQDPAYVEQRSLLEREKGQLYNNLGFAYRVKGQMDLAFEYYQRSLEVRRTRKGAARTLNNMGFVCFLLGDLIKARTYIGRAQKIREQLQIPYELGLGYNTMGIVMEHSGRTDEAADLYHKAIAAFDEAESRRGRALVLTNLGRMRRVMNQFEQAKGYLEEARRTFERLGDTDNLIVVLNELGCVYRQRQEAGDWEAAERLLEASYELAHSVGNSFRQADNLEDLSILYFQWALREKEEGNIDDHERLLRKAEEKAWETLSLAEEHGYTYLKAKVMRTFGDVAYERGEYDEAFEQYVTACEVWAEVVGEKKEPVVQMRRRYEETLDRLQEQLHKLPDEEIVAKAEHLLDAVRQRGLEDRIPELKLILEASIEVHQKALQYIEPSPPR